MYEVLLSIDQEEQRAQRQAEAIRDLPVSPDDVRITVLYVFDELETDVGGTVPMSRFEDPPETEATVAETLDGYEVETVFREGDPATEVVEHATGSETDLVVVASRNRSPAGKAIFGSKTQSVLLDADVPVLVV
ncbi:universal stress protein [Halosimplex halobium]|uniref:universal stress protein n=1 Tax=Halosimplex halobium TaxID=3396618 RepID=UPI003F56EF06